MEKKVCKNCKYYVERYIKRNTYYVSVCGYCNNKDLTEKQRKNCNPEHGDCEHWESNTPKKEERREKIKTVLRDMNKQLCEIALILKDDE